MSDSRLGGKVLSSVGDRGCLEISQRLIRGARGTSDNEVGCCHRLAIEIDLTSRTQLDNYRILGVPELWRYRRQVLQIDILQGEQYVESDSSPTFPGISVIELVNRFVRQSHISGSSQAIEAFRNWVRENLES